MISVEVDTIEQWLSVRKISSLSGVCTGPVMKTISSQASLCSCQHKGVDSREGWIVVRGINVPVQ